jgi:hypothetical protein
MRGYWPLVALAAAIGIPTEGIVLYNQVQQAIISTNQAEVSSARMPDMAAIERSVHANSERRAELRLINIKAGAAFHTGDYIHAELYAREYANGTAQQEMKEKGQQAGDTAAAFRKYAYYALFVRSFEDSLRAGDVAIKIEPNNLVTETNRAHALMFLNRTDEARKLYLAYNGRIVQGEVWGAVIAEDFADLRKAGINHPFMNQIIGLLQK